MTKKIFQSIIIVAATVLLASLTIILGVFYEYFGNIQKGQLTDELNLASVSVIKDGVDYLEQLQSDHYRLTWIDTDGTVLYDTETGNEKLENHKDRAEVKTAFEKGIGESTRYSATLMEKTRYYAKRLEDGTVLRISAKYATTGLLVLGMLQPIIFIIIGALLLSGVLASRLSKRIVEPLNNLDLERPLENETYEEISPLLNRINRQSSEISKQLCRLEEKTDEFNQITESMKEGLVLLDNKGIVLSINPAARNIFGSDTQGAVGHDFLRLDRSRTLSAAIEKTFEEGHSEIRVERMGREYQLDISRIESAGKVLGAVMLAFDITEQEYAERNRREFTANVSHELKTPLQGIIGSADLIETGMVKPEDMPRFIGHIRKEATRLVALIEDIIRLSQLDEGNELPCEEFDLMDIAEEVGQNLESAAGARDITLSLSGRNAIMYGVRRLMYEIVYNLCDNAIKYNLPGGKVEIMVDRKDEEAVLCVKDNGIGIAPEHQDRVFERFYRVDKSHSKSSGGTGLGLSIVKHAVQYHHGKLELKSEIGKGTEITVHFPIEADK
jgi:two-component system phosphate regulon sensor histidine kinase PhoR